MEPRMSVTVQPAPYWGARPFLILHIFRTRTGDVGLYPEEARRLRDALTRRLEEIGEAS